MGRFDGKVVVVTGAGQGLGAELAKEFVAEGAKVIVAGRTLSKLENTVAKIGSPNAVAYKMDCGVEADWINLVEYIKENYGELNVLVNNAAEMINKNILETSYEEFKKAQASNLDSVFLGIKYCYEVLKKGADSSIINVASGGSYRGGPRIGNNDASYHATKAAVMNLTKSAAYVLAKDSIRVNSVHPGGINTDMMKAVLEAYPEMRAGLGVNSPLPPYYAEPEDVAAAVLFLADTASKAMTGSEVVVDNGLLAF